MVNCKSNVTGKIDLTPELKQIENQMYELGYNDLINFNSNELLSYFQGVSLFLEDYLLQFNSSYNLFLQNLGSSVLERMADVLETKKKSSYLKQADLIQGQVMIDLLSKGHEILHLIRKQLTNQKIITKVLVQYNEKTFYELDSSQLTSTLSLFSTNFNNPINNAYVVSRQLIDNLIEQQKIKKIENKILSSLISAKTKYVNQRNYTYRWDWKDTELYYLQTQNNNLTYLKTYQKWRESFHQGGERAGQNTPHFKMGDSALIQSKFVNLKNKNEQEVNYQRFTQIKIEITKLKNILGSGNLSLIQKQLAEMFTVSKEKIKNEAPISKRVNKEGLGNLNKIFDK